MLKISLLGAPRAELDGVAIEVDTRKAVALLAYLAVTGRPHTRDALCNLLWPEYDQEHGRGALRRTLSTLRKALGPEWLDAGRELVALRRDDGMALELDVERFRTRLAAGDPGSLADAVELYRGDFLAGFTLRDSVNFDDWQYFEADSLRRELADALELLVDAHAARSEHERAILLARRWLALNPLHEPAHRRLIELYTLNGERDAALRQYRECVRILDAELGVAPVEETNELYRAVQENRVQVARPAVRKEAVSTATPVEVAVPPALVGREAAWKALLNAYERIGKDGRLVVLEGEPGIGKTRLAEELIGHLSAQCRTVIATRAYEEERELAYAPVAEAVRAALSIVESPSVGALAEAARLLPDVGAASTLPLDSPGAQTRFLESLALLVQTPLAGPSPGLLLFDDVHWADDATHDFLTYVLRRLKGQPMLVLLTWRPEELPPGHRLRRLAAEAGLVIALERLTKDNVAELARSLAPGAAEAQIYEETEGVPLLVVEYCRALARGEEQLPGGVRDMLRGRLEAVSEVAAQVLAAAAVIGRPFDADILREASGRTDEETVAALEELETRGLIGETGDAYDFRHDQLRLLAQEETSLARRRLLHRRVADFLARRPASSGPLAGSVARHYQLAGREEEAAQFFRLAGNHASSLYANVDALAHFRAALALGHPDTAELHQEIGDLETLRGKYEGALASYEAAAAATPPEALARVEHKLGALHLRRGAWDLAVSHLRAALAGAGEDASLTARIAADLSLALHRAGDPKGAAELAEQALERAEAAGERRALAQAHNILGLLAASEGHAAAARPHLEESLALTSAPEDADARAAALNNLALTLRAEGEGERALELTEEALQLCQVQGDRHREAALHNNLADLLRATGRPDDAMAHLKQAVAIFADVGDDAVSRPEIWKLVRW
jgi:DNA-binding SARP family transcriptional activator/Tfp pilus assembly protein PilF